MSQYPKYLKTFSTMDSPFRFELGINRLKRGYPSHRQDYLEFSYVKSGTGWETINGVKHRMEPGTFSFLLPYQIHELFTDPGSELILYNCRFSMELLMEPNQEGLMNGMVSGTEQLPSYVQFEGEEKARVDKLLEEMMEEYAGNDRWRNSFLQVKLKELLIRFDRYRRRNETTPIEEPASGQPAGAVWPIIHYINGNYQEDLTLGGIAKHFSLSISRVSEVIKQATGQTYVHFLQDLRIRHACSLLVSTEMSVSEIALEVGYGSYKTFSRIFRGIKGLSPSEYRKLKTQADETAL
ncbi:helix-turn-helix domain-containing protein [Paenibacillus allorhizosphaerae]|uniref:HTH-type transcriptional activator RhaS n=1 Tax=Paenibacillus allorhizosphaerae TaxID=2849866 RepID=A0ABN7TQT1_9BACL|nr:AraC family transcriptional regulator [Paenibacillus allorhizosphaerae]CAG7651896.1 HTH-type transcriptional activator RhaS [Paenibacillus allorhizosphaerae]